MGHLFGGSVLSAINKGGVAKAPHASFAGGVLTLSLTGGNGVPSGLPYFLIGHHVARCAEREIQPSI